MGGKVGKDAEVGPAAAKRLDSGGDAFNHGVDGVGAHGVPAIHEHVDDEHLAHDGWQFTATNVFAASSQGNHSGWDVVAKRDQSLFCTFHSGHGLVDVGNVQQLDLPNHHR